MIEAATCAAPRLGRWPFAVRSCPLVGAVGAVVVQRLFLLVESDAMPINVFHVLVVMQFAGDDWFVGR